MKTKNKKAISTIIAVTVALSILVAFSVTAASAETNGQQAQEEGAMFQNWDIIPPFYNPEASYNIWGTPGGSGETTRARNELGLPENAVEVAPGVFYLGKAIDKGKVVEGYAFVHYAKGYEPEVLETGDLTDDTSSCYKIIWPDIKWANVEHYVINPTNDFGLDGAEILNTFKDSVSTWEYAGEGEQKYDIIGGGTLTTDVITGRKSDGINMVRFANLGRGIIAMNIIWTDGTNLVEWDQTYSNKFDWSLSGEAGKMDFQNIATHELGHAVGLGDLYSDLCKEQTMYGYSKDGEITKRDLGDGDILGIQKLYGE